MIIKIAKSAIARGINIASALACAIIIGNKYGATAFSEYAFSISFINIASAICLLGFEISINKEYYSESFDRNKKIAGLFVVTAFFSLSYLGVAGYEHITGKPLTTQNLLFATLISLATFYLSNIIKYEKSTYAYEFIRGGGINTACFLILTLAPIDSLDIESHLLVLYGALAVFIACLFLIYPNRKQAPHQKGSSTKNFVVSSIGLSFAAIFSSVIVTGDLILSKILLPQESYETMALMSRLSFLLAIPFVLLNNNQSVEITKLKEAWPLPNKIIRNLGLASIICIVMLIFSEPYLGLFSKSTIDDNQKSIIIAIIIAHAANITSAGLIPYLACTQKTYLNSSIAASLIYFILSYTVIDRALNLPPELKFSLAIYSTLFIFKITTITLSLLAYKKINYDIHR